MHIAHTCICIYIYTYIRLYKYKYKYKYKHKYIYNYIVQCIYNYIFNHISEVIDVVFTWDLPETQCFSEKKKKHPTRYTGQSVWQHGDVDPPMRKWNAWPTANAQNVLWWKHIELIPIQTTAQLLPYIPTVSTWLFLTNGGNDDKWESGGPRFLGQYTGKT